MTLSIVSQPQLMPPWKVPLPVFSEAGTRLAIAHQQHQPDLSNPAAIASRPQMFLACADLEAIVTAVQRLR